MGWGTSPPLPASSASEALAEPEKKEKKRVTFKATCTVRTHHTSASPEERGRLYYSKDELRLLNLEAHAVCTLSQDLPEISNSGTLLGSSRSGADSLRGLELILYPKRKRNKALAQKSLLKYQEHLRRSSSKKQLPNRDGGESNGGGELRRSLALAAASAKLKTRGRGSSRSRPPASTR